MFAIILETAYFENYGSEDLPRWKAKGNSYKTLATNLTANQLANKDYTLVKYEFINHEYAQEHYLGQFIAPMHMLDDNGQYDEYRDDPAQDIFADYKASNENILEQDRRVQHWWNGENTVIAA